MSKKRESEESTQSASLSGHPTKFAFGETQRERRNDSQVSIQGVTRSNPTPPHSHPLQNPSDAPTTSCH